MKILRATVNEFGYSMDGSEVSIIVTIEEKIKSIKMKTEKFKQAFPQGVFEGKTFIALMKDDGEVAGVSLENWYSVAVCKPEEINSGKYDYHHDFA